MILYYYCCSQLCADKARDSVERVFYMFEQFLIVCVPCVCVCMCVWCIVFFDFLFCFFFFTEVKLVFVIMPVMSVVLFGCDSCIANSLPVFVFDFVLFFFFLRDYFYVIGFLLEPFLPLMAGDTVSIDRCVVYTVDSFNKQF